MAVQLIIIFYCYTRAQCSILESRELSIQCGDEVAFKAAVENVTQLNDTSIHSGFLFSE